MKQIFSLICLASFAGTTLAQQPNEEQCKKQVDASISAIEMTTQMKGAEQKLKDLSVKDIREIQKAKGSCAAQQEINKRTMSN
jgi:hypothetical protein